MGFLKNNGGAKNATAAKKVSTKVTIPGAGAGISAVLNNSKKTNTKKKAATTAASIATNATVVQNISPDGACLLQWGNVNFYVKPSAIKSFKSLQIKSTTNTEVQEDSEEGYVTKKKDGAIEMSLTAILDMRLGESDVMAYAMELCEMCRTGASSYVYAKGRKLITSGMMGVSSSVDKVELAPDGTWISCEVKLTMKQCEKGGGGTSAPASTSTAKSSGGKSTGKQTILQKVGKQLKTAKTVSSSSGSKTGGWASSFLSKIS